MNRSSALLAALRARSDLTGPRIGRDALEALAGALGLSPEDLPTLVAELQHDGKIALAWGGDLDILPERRPDGTAPHAPSGPTFNFQGATFGPGATVAGRDATGATVTMTPEAALGALAAVLEGLRGVRPELSGEAARAADQAEKALGEAMAPSAPPAAKQTAAQTARSALVKLMDYAPKAKALVDLADKAFTALT